MFLILFLVKVKNKQGRKIMKISLRNISKIGKAEIEIKGITVIAGENNSGKSTIGKALWSIFNGFYNIKNELENERINLISHKLAPFFMMNDSNNGIDRETIKELFLNNSYKEIKELEEVLLKILNIQEENSIKMLSEELYEILNLTDDYILKIHFNNILSSEFNQQINSVYNQNEGEIELTISNQNILLKIISQKVENIKTEGAGEKLNLYTKAIYIDDPYLIDNLNHVFYTFIFNTRRDHRADLRNLLSIKEKKNIVEDALISKKLERIDQKLEEIFKGEMLFNFNNGKVKLKNSSEELDIKNLSTGLKTFVILKKLIANGALERKGTIILDEPEIHLHPEWQLLFAEIIVLLQKELDLHILLATHSPYFLRAIQVYAANYEIADKCKYYLAENKDNIAIITDVSEKIDLIFKKLVKPFQKLEDLMYEGL